MGSRSEERGNAAIQELISEDAKCEGKVELVKVDVSDPASITEAAANLKAKLGDKKLYALVNNAGTGFAHKPTREAVLKTNYYGPKFMCDAMIPLIQNDGGRIVNMGSGMGVLYVVQCDDEVKKFLSSEQITWEQLDTYVKETYDKLDDDLGFKLTKAALHKYTEICAKQNPTLLLSVVSPGFVETNMSKGMNAPMKPHEGTVSARHGLFADLTGSGFYYGSDAKRSPLHE